MASQENSQTEPTTVQRLQQLEQETHLKIDALAGRMNQLEAKNEALERKVDNLSKAVPLQDALPIAPSVDKPKQEHNKDALASPVNRRPKDDTSDSPNSIAKKNQTRFERYRALGSTSRARLKAQGSYVRRTSSSQSVARSKPLSSMDDFDHFCELLCAPKLLNPSQYIDWIVSIVVLFTGSDQTVSLHKLTVSSSTSDEQPIAVTNVYELMPCLAPRDRFTTDLNLDNSATLTPPYCFAALPDQRTICDGRDSVFMLNTQFRWTALRSTKVRPPSVASLTGPYTPTAPLAQQRPQKIHRAALISDGEHVTHCVYAAARGGLFYNPFGQNDAVQILDATHTVLSVFRQHDHLYVLCTRPHLYLFELTLTAESKEVEAKEVLHTSDPFRSSASESIIGVYYDEDRERLLVGKSSGLIMSYQVRRHSARKASWQLSTDVQRKMGKLQSHLMFAKQKTKGNLKSHPSGRRRGGRYSWYSQRRSNEMFQHLHFDDATNHCVLVGSDMVVRVSMDEDASPYKNMEGFAKIYDTASVLKGVDGDCLHFLYIYHQNSLVILRRVASGAQYPYQVRVFANSLCFE